MNYNFKALYDCKLILNKNKIEVKKTSIDKFFGSFQYKSSYLKIDFLKNFKKKKSILFRIRFYLKSNFRLFNRFDNFIFKQIHFLKFRPEQIIEFFNNSIYRNYVIQKTFNNQKD